MAGLSSLPRLRSTTKASLSDKVGRASRGDNGEEPEEVQYCDVNCEELLRVHEYTEGENVIVWFQGKKGFAWMAKSVK